MPRFALITTDRNSFGSREFSEQAALVIFLQSACATGRNATRELPRFGLNTIPLPTAIVPAVRPQPKISPPAFLALPVCLTLAWFSDVPQFLRKLSVHLLAM